MPGPECIVFIEQRCNLGNCFFSAISVDTTQTNLGEDSPTIACIVGDISSVPDTFSYTIGDGTTTWAQDTTTDDVTVTSVSYISPTPPLPLPMHPSVPSP